MTQAATDRPCWYCQREYPANQAFCGNCGKARRQPDPAPTPSRFIGAFLAAGVVGLLFLLLGLAALDALSAALGFFLPVEYLAAAGVAAAGSYWVALKVFAGGQGVPSDKRETAAAFVTTVLVLIGVAWLLAHGAGADAP